MKNADDYLKLVRFTVNSPDDGYKKAMNKFIEETHEDFFKLDPTMDQVHVLKKASGDLGLDTTIMKKALKKMKNADDYLKLVRFTVNSPDDGYKKAMNKFIEETHEDFFKLDPTMDQVHVLKKASGDLGLDTTIMKKALKKMKNADDYLKLVRFTVNSPDDGYKKAMSKFVDISFDTFLKTNPDNNHLSKVLKLSTNKSRLKFKYSLNGKIQKLNNLKSEVTSFSRLMDILPFSEMSDSATKQSIHYFIDKNLDWIMSLNPSVDDIIELRKKSSLPVAADVALIERNVSRVKGSDDFFQLMEVNYNDLSSTEMDSYRAVASKNQDQFFSTNPSIDETINFEKKYLLSIDDKIKLKRRMVAGIANKEDLFKVFDFNMTNPSEDYVLKLQELLDNNSNFFTKYDFNVEDVNKLISRGVVSEQTHIMLAKDFLPKVDTMDEIKKLHLKRDFKNDPDYKAKYSSAKKRIASSPKGGMNCLSKILTKMIEGTP